VPFFPFGREILKITVECASPKYVKGNYDFARLEDVFNFLVRIKGFSRGNIGRWLLNIAKDGRIAGAYTARYGLKIESDFHNYALAQKIAKETELVQSFNKVSSKPEIAMAFAKAFDREANKK